MMRFKIQSRSWMAVWVIAFTLSACSVQNPQPPVQLPTSQPAVSTPAGTALAAETQPSPTWTATPIPYTPTPLPMGIWLAPYLPQAFRESIQLAPGVTQVQEVQQADYLLRVGAENQISQWVYALVAPFPTIPDGVSEQELHDAWQGKRPAAFAEKPLLMDDSTLGVLTAAWGAPTEGAVKTLPTEDLLHYAWQDAQPFANEQPPWAILPFESLEPRWKVLKIDGRSPIDEVFNPASYPLAVSFSLAPNPDKPATAQAPAPDELLAGWMPFNRDDSKMTTVMMTGVTALVRATAETMRRKGITYPAQDIRDWLLSADFTHVSNEIPFSPDCPLPDAWQKELVFCSNPAYIELFKDIGADVIELTGDHFGDWGPEAMRYTLDLYKQNNLPYYGGGYNLEDARKPLLIEHNGNRLAFIGCNSKEAGYGTASETNPGAVHCDFDWLNGEISRLRSEGYLPIVTFQDTEYYSYVPQPKLIKDFRPSAEAGAAIVSGSQAHQPHGMEFYDGAFIHYGLGNLFFDQYHMGLPTGQGFLDRHVFYDGRYISTELLGIRFVDFARSRPMSPEERQELLKSVFDASLW
jgi:hypothetical protein